MDRRMATVQANFAKRMRFLRLRGLLKGNPTANILHVLLVGVLLWTAGNTVLFVATPYVGRTATAVLLLYLATSTIIAVLLLRRGALHNASIVYPWCVGLIASVLIGHSGGSHSPALVLYAAIPILPGRLRQELTAALMSLDTGRESEVIRRASERDRDLGAKLSHHVDSLAFTPILRALEAFREHSGEEAT